MGGVGGGSSAQRKSFIERIERLEGVQPLEEEKAAIGE